MELIESAEVEASPDNQLSDTPKLDELRQRIIVLQGLVLDTQAHVDKVVTHIGGPVQDSCVKVDTKVSERPNELNFLEGVNRILGQMELSVEAINDNLNRL